MNENKAMRSVEYGCMFFYFTLILMVCGSALGYGASAGLLPGLKTFIDSGNAEKLAQIAGIALGVLIGVGIVLSVVQGIVRLLKP